MQGTQIIHVVNNYATILMAYGAKPVRCEDQQYLVDVSHINNHLLWMCGEVKKIVADGRIEKAMRWLGFLQGAMWACRLRTLEEMKKDNKPDGDEFDNKRI